VAAAADFKIAATVWSDTLVSCNAAPMSEALRAWYCSVVSTFLEREREREREVKNMEDVLNRYLSLSLYLSLSSYLAISLSLSI